VNLPADINRADAFGTDIEIFPWREQAIWADTRTAIPESAHQILRLYGFVRICHEGIIDSHELPADMPWSEQELRTTRASELLTSLGFRVNLDPDLYAEAALPPSWLRPAACSRPPRPVPHPPPASSSPLPARPAPPPYRHRPLPR
jgi:hypothetical protein